MKQLFIITLALSTHYSLFSQSATQVREEVTIAPSKYASTLYVEDVSSKEGNIKQLASHVSISGPATLKWSKTPGAGQYYVVLDYSVRQEGAQVIIGTAQDSITSVINPTSSVYVQNKEWYQFNSERKLLPGTLSITGQDQSIELKLISPSKDFESIIYAVELIPADKKAAIIEENKRIISARPGMKTFASMQYGVMFHWTSLTTPRSGNLAPYKDAVKSFDVKAFTNMVVNTGADYVIFTGCWAETFIPAPLKKWEKEYPGHTTERDLLDEISTSLKKKNIKFILYLSTHIYGKIDSVDAKEFERLNFELIPEIGERYKKKIDGFWFDGWYQSYRKYPGFDFEKFYKLCKTGNPGRLIALNSWLYPAVSEWQDYWAGEIYSPGALPTAKIITKGPGKGLQFQSLVVLQSDWAHTGLDTPIQSPRLSSKDLIQYINGCKGKGPVTINLEIYQDGTIGEEALTVMKEIKAAIKK